MLLRYIKKRCSNYRPQSSLENVIEKSRLDMDGNNLNRYGTYADGIPTYLLMKGLGTLHNESLSMP